VIGTENVPVVVVVAGFIVMVTCGRRTVADVSGLKQYETAISAPNVCKHGDWEHFVYPEDLHFTAASVSRRHSHGAWQVMVPGAVAVVVFIWTFGLIVATGLIPVRAAFAEQQRTIRSMTVIKSVLR